LSSLLLVESVSADILLTLSSIRVMVSRLRGYELILKIADIPFQTGKFKIRKLLKKCGSRLLPLKSLESNHIGQAKLKAAVHDTPSHCNALLGGWLDPYLWILIRSISKIGIKYRELVLNRDRFVRWVFGIDSFGVQKIQGGFDCRGR
jgi:hypothetical protein